MLKEAQSFLKNKIKDPDLQDRALKLLESAFSYVEMDERKQKTLALKKETAKVKEKAEAKLKSKEDKDAN